MTFASGGNGRGARGGSKKAYRYLRFQIDAVQGGSHMGFFDLRFSDDGGATLYPPNMTGLSSPAPNVVSASSTFSGSFAAPYAFDANITGTRWTSASGVTSGHIQVDLGAGNEIVPDQVRYQSWNSSGNNMYPRDFRIIGSNDDFVAENDVLLELTGQPSQSHAALVTHAIP